MTAATHIDTGAAAADLRQWLDVLYPGPLALLLAPLCAPTRPHQHKGRDGVARGCANPGKRPLSSGWNAEAVERWRAADADRGAHVDAIARHVGGDGNCGWVVPPGVLVLDADTAEAVTWLDLAIPDAPMQESRPGRAHFVVKVPRDLTINATVKAELAPGVFVDVRSPGRSQIVVEPSTHATGSHYTWKQSLPRDLADLPECPPAILARIVEPAPRATAPSGGRKITQGGRNAYVHRIGCGMRGRGMAEPEIRAELQRENARHCDPPLDAGEVDAIADSVLRYVAGDASERVEREREPAANEPTTDTGNAERLVRLHGADLRHVHTWGRWLAWDGRRFAPDASGEIQRRAKDAVRRMYVEASELDEEPRKALAKWAHKSESAARIEAMTALARSEPGIPIAHDELDANPWLLNVENGTLDLRTGELQEHRRGDLLTKLAPVAYDTGAKAPIWAAFLERVMPDGGVRGFLRRAIGYSLTGDTGEQVIFLLWGSGANGKSTFVETIMTMLGDHAIKTQAETLLAKRENAIPNDVAALRGARLVAAVESEEGRRLAEVRVKELTGGDTVSARFMRAEWFAFKPVCKIWLATNHRPQVRGTDEAIWRRIRLIPFAVTIPEDERDTRLLSRLRAELPGILAWAVEGCLEWQRDGLQPPAAVMAATSNYRAEQDVIGAFLADRYVSKPGAFVASADLYRAYRAWAEGAGEHVMAQRKLGLVLRERGLDDGREGKGRVRGWYGIGLLDLHHAPEGGHKADATT